MSLVRSKPDQARALRRRKVRIVGRRTPPRAATWSLIAAAAAALLIPILWRIERKEEVVPPAQRTLADLEMQWRCETGHTFQASGHAFNEEGMTQPKACWTCGRPAYPVYPFYCPVHGAVEVAVMFTRDASGREQAARWRLPGRSWVKSMSDLRCRLCERPLEHRRDPLRGGRPDWPPGGD